jgi:hypothetical protein
MEGSPIIAEVRDPDGRPVQLDAQTWNYVLSGHDEMVDYLEEVMEAIRLPDHRQDDLRVGRQRYFRRGGPEAWLRVVTEFVGEFDRVVTAFPQSNDPREEAWQR